MSKEINVIYQGTAHSIKKKTFTLRLLGKTLKGLLTNILIMLQNSSWVYVSFTSLFFF